MRPLRVLVLALAFLMQGSLGIENSAKNDFADLNSEPKAPRMDIDDVGEGATSAAAEQASSMAATADISSAVKDLNDELKSLSKMSKKGGGSLSATLPALDQEEADQAPVAKKTETSREKKTAKSSLKKMAKTQAPYDAKQAPVAPKLDTQSTNSKHVIPKPIPEVASAVTEAVGGTKDGSELREGSTTKITLTPAEEAKKKEIAAAEAAKAKAVNDAEAAKIKNAVKVAEQKALEESKKSSVIAKGAPVSLPDPVAPPKKTKTPAVEAAGVHEMPAVRGIHVLPDGEYMMEDGSAAKVAAKLQAIKAWDATINAHDGRVPRVLPATLGQYVKHMEGGILTTDGFMSDKVYKPATPTGTGYCKDYVARPSNAPKWTSAYCLPKHSNFNEMMSNLDGVACACGGIKVANVPESDAQPDIQESAYARTQVTTERIRAYGYKMSSGVDKTSTRPAHGFTWETHLADEQSMVSDHAVDPTKMQSIFITFNRITEFVDKDKKGLRPGAVKQYDSESGELWGGLQCDGGMSNLQYPSKNCIKQEFFLDHFELAKLTAAGTKLKFQYKSDLQGTAPWCLKSDPTCANPPNLKPTVTIDVTVDTGKFEEANFNMTVENFPYQGGNTTSLGFGVSMYASSIQDDAQNGRWISMGDHHRPQVQMKWDSTIKGFAANATSPTNYNVIAPSPERFKSTAVVNGMRLVHKKVFFSFEHHGAQKLTWTPNLWVTPAMMHREVLKMKGAADTLSRPAFITLTVLALATLAVARQ